MSLKRIESFLIGDRGPEIFLELQEEVQSQLENKHYHRFLVSPLYNKMMLDAEEAGIDFINATVGELSRCRLAELSSCPVFMFIDTGPEYN